MIILCSILKKPAQIAIVSTIRKKKEAFFMKGIADFTRGPVTKQLICFALPLFNQACYIFGYG